MKLSFKCFFFGFLVINHQNLLAAPNSCQVTGSSFFLNIFTFKTISSKSINIILYFVYCSGRQLTTRFDGCEQVSINVNICLGCCLSQSFPTQALKALTYEETLFTTKSSCCSMVSSKEVI